MFMAAFMGLVGYGLQWFVIRGIISVPYVMVSQLSPFFLLILATELCDARTPIFFLWINEEST